MITHMVYQCYHSLTRNVSYSLTAVFFFTVMCQVDGRFPVYPELPTLASKKEEHCQARRTPSAANADRGELPNFENSEVT